MKIGKQFRVNGRFIIKIDIINNLEGIDITNRSDVMKVRNKCKKKLYKVFIFGIIRDSLKFFYTDVLNTWIKILYSFLSFFKLNIYTFYFTDLTLAKPMVYVPTYVPYVPHYVIQLLLSYFILKKSKWFVFVMNTDCVFVRKDLKAFTLFGYACFRGLIRPFCLSWLSICCVPSVLSVSVCDLLKFLLHI